MLHMAMEKIKNLYVRGNKSNHWLSSLLPHVKVNAENKKTLQKYK